MQESSAEKTQKRRKEKKKRRKEERKRRKEKEKKKKIKMSTTLALKVVLGGILLPVATLAAIIAKVLLKQLYNTYRYRATGCNIPAAKEVPFLGGYTRKQPHQEKLDNFKELGPINYSTMFDIATINVGDPDLINYMLLK